MFTKYTDIDLPKNYSGSRFKHTLADTKMKTHRAQDVSLSVPAFKTAVSPSFQDIIDKTAKATKVDEQPEELYANNDTTAELTDQEAEKSDEKADAAFKDSLPIDAHPRHDEGSNTDFFSLFKASGFGKLLSNKSKDDFLLIALIALLASDGSGDNLDAIVLLALLLLYS